MYQEEVADLTAAHLREHIGALLTATQAIYNDKVVLQHPKAIETANLVGGVYNADPTAMPAYAVDIVNKQFAGDAQAGLWLFLYEGHIAGVLSGASESSVNAAIKRHEQATEKFVKSHQHMHSLASAMGNDFRIVELGFSGAAFSGAEQVNAQNDRELWIAGFRIDLTWVVSEDGPGDY
jgi:hypothetical protein